MEGTERSAGILARMIRKMNPRYARRRTAAVTYPPLEGRAIAYGFLESFPSLGFAPAYLPWRGPRNRIVNKAESNWERLLCVHHWPRPEAPAASGGFSICDSPALEGEGKQLHRHLAVTHRSAGGDGLGRVDDGVGVHAVVAIEIVDRPGLPEMLDAERFHLVAP